MADQPPFPTAIASYDSDCMCCEHRIEEGDAIGYLEDEDEWVHRECAWEWVDDG